MLNAYVVPDGVVPLGGDVTVMTALLHRKFTKDTFPAKLYRPTIDSAVLQPGAAEPSMTRFDRTTPLFAIQKSDMLGVGAAMVMTGGETADAPEITSPAASHAGTTTGAETCEESTEMPRTDIERSAGLLARAKRAPESVAHASV